MELPSISGLCTGEPYGITAKEVFYSGCDHFQEICATCGIIISQCRCMGCNKSIKYGTCQSCKDKANSNAPLYSTESCKASKLPFISCDVDGCLRDLEAYLQSEYGVPSPTNWNWKYEGKNMFQWVAKDFTMLSKSPKMKYFDAIMDYGRKLNESGKVLELWTNQPENWKPEFWKWILKHVDPTGVKYTVKFLTREQKYDMLNNRSDVDYLIEDHPKLPTSDKIIFIDHTYNQDSMQPNRVRSVKELKEFLK